MQQYCGDAERGHTPANARAQRCEPRQVRRRRALLRSQPCRRHPTARPTSSSAPAVPHRRRQRSRSDAALPAPRLPALRPLPCDRAVDPTTSRAMPLSPNVPGARRRDTCRCAIAAADPPRPQACAGRGGWPPAGFFYLRRFVCARFLRCLRPRSRGPLAAAPAHRAASHASGPCRRDGGRLARARVTQTATATGHRAHASAGYCTGARRTRRGRTEVAFSIQTQATRFVSLRTATHSARRCEGAQRPRRPLARRAGSGCARGTGARLRLRAAPAPTT